MKKTLVLVLLLGLLAACGGGERGQLEFVANGEDFVREGFTSKDGWDIEFSRVVVSLSEIEAFNVTGYDASSGEAPFGDPVSAGGSLTVDLAAGGAGSDPISLRTVNAPAGQYGAVRWKMPNSSDGQTIVMDGNAQKGSQNIFFTISITDTYAYTCGEFIGDERKGFVEADDSGNVELTFHFDHVFGDIHGDDDFNAGALGFQPLADLAANGDWLNMDQAGLEREMDSADYELMLSALGTLGHVGEGHCYENGFGYTGGDE